MEMLDNLATGLEASFTLTNLFYAFLGCFLGTIVGVLPGLGPLATIAMLLPFTYGLEPLTALIMLAGLYYGAQYGGSTTAILVNLPGETSSVVTCIDGYQMARQGRAGTALGIAALASFFAGCVGTLVIAGFAKPISAMAVEFKSPEYFSLMVLGLVGAAAMTSATLTKSVAMVMMGLLLGMVGPDSNSGASRFTFGLNGLWDGIELVTIAMGLFGFAEIIKNLEQREQRESFTGRVSNLWPSHEDFRRSWAATLRGTFLGVIVGALPGAGSSVASFGSYAMERRLSKHPEQFGKGAVEGVAGPEAANNSAAQCNFIPLLTLGLPGSGTMALLAGAMIIHGVQPGPQVISRNPDLFWGLIVSMWIGNAMLLMLNLPLIRIWVRLLNVPYRFLYPGILSFSCIGVYSFSNSVFHVYLTAFFGLVGYLFHKLRCEPAPLMLGFVLGPLMEENFRRSLVISRGDFDVFITRPVSAGLLFCAALVVILVAFPAVRKKKEIALGSE